MAKRNVDNQGELCTAQNARIREKVIFCKIKVIKLCTVKDRERPSQSKDPINKNWINQNNAICLVNPSVVFLDEPTSQS